MKKKTIILIAGLIFAAALGLVLYPLAAVRYNEVHQSSLCAAYEEQFQQMDISAVAQIYSQAEAYNQRISARSVGDPFGDSALAEASIGYASLLNLGGTDMIGYLEIPAIEVSLPIYHGTETDTLRTGVGHLLGTSLPIGGEDTHTVLSAHSGMASQRMFTDLDQLREGDIFYLRVLGETLSYQVDQIKVVLPYETQDLSIVAGEDLCTLLTCTPFGVNTHRLLVRGSRIPYESAEEIIVESVAPQESTWLKEYLRGILFGGIAAAGIGAVTWCCLRKRGKYEA